MRLSLIAALVAGSWGFMTAESTAGAAQMVKGVVTDSATKRPISGVTVIIVGTDLKSTTGQDGWYRLSPVAKGDHVVRAEVAGYTTVEHSVPVADTGAVTLDFTLIATKTGGARLGQRTLQPNVERPSGQPSASVPRRTARQNR